MNDKQHIALTFYFIMVIYMDVTLTIFMTIIVNTKTLFVSFLQQDIPLFNIISYSTYLNLRPDKILTFRP